MYTDVILTLILLVLLWIAVGLQIIASSILSLGKLFRFPTISKLRRLEQNNMPFIAKMVTVKIISHIAIRYFTKRIR